MYSLIINRIEGRRWDNSEPPWALWMRVTIAALGVAWIIALIGPALQLPDRVGQGYAPTTSEFQLTWSSDLRQTILGFWQRSPGMLFIASCVLVVDALLLVPLYVAAFVLLAQCLRRSRDGIGTDSDRVAPNTSKRAAIAGWAVLAGAICDQVENVLSIWLVTTAVPSSASPLLGGTIALFAWAKWSLLLGSLFVSLSLGWSIARRLGLKAIKAQLLAWARIAAHAVEMLCLYGFAIGSLVVGIVLVGFVPQTQDVLTSLGLDPVSPSVSNQLRLWNLFWLGAGVLIWAGALWLGMWFVARWTPSHSEGGATLYPWVRYKAPRLLSYFGLVAVATLCALHMSARASFAMGTFMCLGAVIMFDVASTLLSRAAQSLGLYAPDATGEAPSYRQPVLGAALVALVVAWVSVGADPVPVLDDFGWFMPPDRVWRWSGSKITEQTLLLAVLFLGAAIAYAVNHLYRTSARVHLTLSAVGFLCWWIGAALVDSELAVLVFGVVLLAAAAALWFLIDRRHFDRKKIEWFGAIASTAAVGTGWALERPDRDLGRALIVGAVALVILFSTTPLLGSAIGTLGVGFLALAMWSLLLGWIFIYWPKRLGLGNWMIVPIIWVLVFGQQADHSIRAVPLGKDARSALATPSVQQHFKQWRQDLADPNESPVFLVAASGGGLRAAYWTATLLAAMDDRTCGRFGDHVFAVSGVSGGSLGLAAYLAQRRVWAAKPDTQKCQAGRLEEMQRFLRRDYLGPVAGSLLFAEAVQAFVPYTYLQQERGRTLADAIARGWQETYDGENGRLLERPFLDLFATGADRGRVPAVYLNATGIESGRRVIASNVQLGSMLADPIFYESSVSRGTRLQTAGLSAIDAVVNSARFPGVSPPGRVWGCGPTFDRSKADLDHCNGIGYGPWGHVVDGGFFENSGLETLMDVRRDLLASSPTSLGGDRLPPVFVITISNDSQYRTECPGVTPRYALTGKDANSAATANALVGLQRRAFAEPYLPEGYGSGGSDWGAPLASLMSVREGRAQLESRRAAEVVGCSHFLEWSLAGQTPGRKMKNPPLGWLLSKRSVSVMDAGVENYTAAFPFDAMWCAKDGVRSRGWIGRTEVPDGAVCPTLTESTRPALRPSVDRDAPRQ